MSAHARNQERKSLFCDINPQGDKQLVATHFVTAAVAPAMIHRQALGHFHAALREGSIPSAPHTASSYAVQYDCGSCHACKSVRIDLIQPLASKSIHKLIVQDMFNVRMAVADKPDLDEHFALFTAHYQARHDKWLKPSDAEGANFGYFAHDIQGCTVFEFRDNQNGKLVGATMLDLMPPLHGESAPSAYGHFNYYQPPQQDIESLENRESRESPGLVQFGRVGAWLAQQGFAHFYLGRWTPQPSIYSYKGRFQPEIWHDNEWQDWDAFHAAPPVCGLPVFDKGMR